MILSKNKKIIFLHIPKTAGTSITDTISSELKDEKIITGGVKKDWNYHSSISLIENRLETLDNYFIFSFVRNPWDRLFSWFSMLKEVLYKEKNPNFKQWLLSDKHEMSDVFFTKNKKLSFSAQRTPQIDYMLDSNGVNRVHFIGKFENIKNDFGIICSLLNIDDFELGYNRVSNHIPYRKAYDNEMKEFVAHYHKKDIEAFGYKF
jgi:hypothetical protein